MQPGKDGEEKNASLVNQLANGVSFTLRYACRQGVSLEEFSIEFGCGGSKSIASDV
jgi:hypothetical protein